MKITFGVSAIAADRNAKIYLYESVLSIEHSTQLDSIHDMFSQRNNCLNHITMTKMSIYVCMHAATYITHTHTIQKRYPISIE